MAGLVMLDEIKILPDGVSGTPVPVHAYSLLRWHNLQEVADFLAECVPAIFQVVSERLVFVLRQYDNLVDLRVHAITQSEIDESIDTAKWNRRLGTIPGKRHEPLTPATSHDKSKGVFHLSILSLSNLSFIGQPFTHKN